MPGSSQALCATAPIVRGRLIEGIRDHAAGEVLQVTDGLGATLHLRQIRNKVPSRFRRWGGFCFPSPSGSPRRRRVVHPPRQQLGQADGTKQGGYIVLVEA